MNIILLYSSILMLIAFCVLLWFYFKNKTLYYVIAIIAIIGIILGILNHGMSYKWCKYCDRLYMILSFFIYLYILHKFYDNKFYIFIIIPVIFYIIAKSIKNYNIKTLFHLLAHTSIVYFHFIILLNLKT